MIATELLVADPSRAYFNRLIVGTGSFAKGYDSAAGTYPTDMTGQHVDDQLFINVKRYAGSRNEEGQE